MKKFILYICLICILICSKTYGYEIFNNYQESTEIERNTFCHECLNEDINDRIKKLGHKVKNNSDFETKLNYTSKTYKNNIKDNQQDISYKGIKNYFNFFSDKFSKGYMTGYTAPLYPE